MLGWARAEVRSRRRLLLGLAAGSFALMLVVALSYRSLGRGALGHAFSGRAPSYLQALSGSRHGDVFSPHGWLSFGFTHPLFLTMTLTVAVALGTALIAGEVESGRAQLLFSRPVARRAFLLTGLVLWLVAELSVLLAAAAGMLVGGWLTPELRDAGLGPMLLAPLQYLPLALLVAAVAFLSSAAARTRGRALGVCVGLVVASYLVNFTAGLFTSLGWLRWLTPWGYYDPLGAVEGGYRWAPAAGLTAAALGALMLAARIFEQRDLA